MPMKNPQLDRAKDGVVSECKDACRIGSSFFSKNGGGLIQVESGNVKKIVKFLNTDINKCRLISRLHLIYFQNQP